MRDIIGYLTNSNTFMLQGYPLGLQYYQLLNPDFLLQVIKDYLQFAPQTVSILKSKRTLSRFIVTERIMIYHLNPIACRKTKIAYKFGLSECSRVKTTI